MPVQRLFLYAIFLAFLSMSIAVIPHSLATIAAVKSLEPKSAILPRQVLQGYFLIGCRLRCCRGLFRAIKANIEPSRVCFIAKNRAHGDAQDIEDENTIVVRINATVFYRKIEKPLLTIQYGMYGIVTIAIAQVATVVGPAMKALFSAIRRIF
jgi:hypothetical protein